VPLKGIETETKCLGIRRLQSTSLISVLIVFCLGGPEITNYKELGWVCEERWEITNVSDKNQREWS